MVVLITDMYVRSVNKIIKNCPERIREFRKGYPGIREPLQPHIVRLWYMLECVGSVNYFVVLSENLFKIYFRKFKYAPTCILITRYTFLIYL